MADYELSMEVVEITPAKAKEIVEKQNIGNRILNQVTVNHYADQMKRGLWILNGEAIQFDRNGILRNGQHRLYGVVKAEVAVKFLFVYNVPDEAFATYDLQRTRTTADLFHIEGIKYATNKAALIKRYLLLTKDKTDFYVSSKRRSIVNTDQLAEYKNNIEFYDEVYAKTEKLYQKLPVLTTSDYGGYMAYLIREKKHDIHLVFSFFNQLVLIEPSKYAVIDMLRDRLYKLKLLKNNKNKEKYPYIVKAWNAFVSHKDLKFLSFDETKEKTPQFL